MNTAMDVLLTKENWELTLKQYCEKALITNKYRTAYEAKPDIWNQKCKTELITKWVSALLIRSEVGALPTAVIQSFIRTFDEGVLLHTFRGIRQKGVANYRIPSKVYRFREEVSAQ